MTNLKRAGQSTFTLTEGVAECPDVYAEWEMTVPYEDAAPCEKCGVAAPISGTYQITLVGAAAGIDYDFIAIRHRENKFLPKGQEHMEAIYLELTVKSFLDFGHAVSQKRPEIHRRALVDMLIHVRDYALERISRSEQLLREELAKMLQDLRRSLGINHESSAPFMLQNCEEAKTYFSLNRMKLDYLEALFVLGELREFFHAVRWEATQPEVSNE